MFFSVFSNEVVPQAIHRYEEQGEIVDRLTNRLLEGREYFLGSEYSIVDIAFFGWYHAANEAGFPIERNTNLGKWFERVAARPAVARGVTIPRPLPAFPPRKRA
jgi:GST-like protein